MLKSHKSKIIVSSVLGVLLIGGFTVWWNVFRISESLHYAVFNADVSRVKELIANGYNVDVLSTKTQRRLVLAENFPYIRGMNLWEQGMSPIDVQGFFPDCGKCELGGVPEVIIDLIDNVFPCNECRQNIESRREIKRLLKGEMDKK